MRLCSTRLGFDGSARSFQEVAAMHTACASADLYLSAMKRKGKTRCHTQGGRIVIETVKGVWGSHPISLFVPDYFSVMACLYIFYFLSDTFVNT